MSYRDFPKDEYDKRLKRARNLMEEVEVEALLLTDPPNIIYLSGFQSALEVSKFRPLMGLVPKEGDPALILPRISTWHAEESSYWDDIREWSLIVPGKIHDPSECVKNLIEEKDLTNAKVGIELGLGMRPSMSPSQLDNLYKTVPNIKFIDSVPILTKLRMAKSEREIERIREASRMLDKAFEAALDFTREGVTDTQVVEVMKETTKNEGAVSPSAPTCSAGKEMHLIMSATPRGYTVKKGDMMIFDHVVAYRSYFGDMSRQIFIGQPSKETKHFYEVSLEATKASEEDAKPGMTAAEIDALATNVYKKYGLEKYMLHRLGHTIGLEVHEMPSFDPTDHTVILEGTTFTAEPGIYDAEIGQFRIEDTVVLRKNGCELLNNAPRELDEVIR